MKTLVLILQIISALALIAVVLLQPGKSAGLSGSIAGGSEALFGSKAKTVNEFLEKITGWVAAVFVITTLALALI